MHAPTEFKSLQWNHVAVFRSTHNETNRHTDFLRTVYKVL